MLANQHPGLPIKGDNLQSLVSLFFTALCLLWYPGATCLEVLSLDKLVRSFVLWFQRQRFSQALFCDIDLNVFGISFLHHIFEHLFFFFFFLSMVLSKVKSEVHHL